MTFQIRAAVPGDLAAITSVYVECFNAPPWHDGWSFAAAHERLSAYLETRQFRGAIALSEQTVVGLLIGQKERWVNGFHFFLQEMCVAPSQQRRGVGRALLVHIRAALQ